MPDASGMTHSDSSAGCPSRHDAARKGRSRDDQTAKDLGYGAADGAPLRLDDSPGRTLIELSRLLAAACERRRTTPLYTDFPAAVPPDGPTDLIDVRPFALMGVDEGGRA